MAKALQLQPDSPELNLGMGNLIAPINPSQAIRFFGAALKARPEYPEALFNLANAWVATGNPDRAIPYLERAVELRPEWTQAQQNLKILRGSVGTSGPK